MSTDIRIRPVDPAADSDLIHAWVTQERAFFWGMTENSRDEVEEIYTYIGEQPHLAAYLVSLGDTPVAIFQTYDPEVDEIGQFYDREPGDLGVHLFLADTPARGGRTREIFGFLIAQVMADDKVRRLVVEPDARNEKSLRLFEQFGAAPGDPVELPNKTARFGFITRELLNSRA